MRKIIFSFFLSFFFFQAQATNRTIQIKNSYEPSNEYIVKGIRVRGEGIHEHDKDILTNISSLSVGDKITIPGEKITLALKSFLETGLFSWGKVLVTKKLADSVWIEFVVEPNPIVSNIVFFGVKKEEKEDLEYKIGIFKGCRLAPNLVSCAEKWIKKYFENKGFNRVEVQIQYNNDPVNNGKVIVNIFIQKNQKIKVRRIYLLGNHNLSDYMLKMIMQKTDEDLYQKKKLLLILKKLFSSNTFIQEEYKKNLEKIILKYNEHGYLDASIVIDSLLLANKEQTDIQLLFSEGNQYTIRNIRWVGNTLYSSDKLSRLLNIQPGDIYNQKKLQARLFTDEDAICNLYYNNGYIFSSINLLEVNIENDSVDLEIRIREGIQTTINQVIINGNDKVYEDVIRRELATKPGMVFSREALMKSTRKIVQMGYFNSDAMDVQCIPNDESGTVDIYYNLASKDDNQIDLSIAHEKIGLVGCMNLKFYNFSLRNMFKWKESRGIIPRGDGQSLTFNAQTNGYCYQSYGVSFYDPWFRGKRPDNFSLNTYYVLQNDTLVDPPYNEDTRTFGLLADYGKHLSGLDDFFILNSNLSYQRYWMKNHKKCNDTINNLALSFIFNRNSTDNSTYIEHGSIFSLSINATPPYSLWAGTNYSNSLKDDSTMFKWEEYHKWKFKGTIFVPLNGHGKIKQVPVLMNRIECGFLGTYNSKFIKWNSFGTFDMGGSGRMFNYFTPSTHEIIGLRGYGSGALTPEGGGCAYSKLTLEWHYPLFLNQTLTAYGLAFLEAGNIWKEVKDFRPFQVKRSAGIGIRILLPIIGLIGFDWAYGFDAPNNQPDNNKDFRSQFHFVVGKEF